MNPLARRPLPLLCSLLAALLLLGAWSRVNDATVQESTPGRLASWLAEQSSQPPAEIRSPLAQLADSYADHLGMDALDTAQLHASLQQAQQLSFALLCLLLAAAAIALIRRHPSVRYLFVSAIFLLDIMLFMLPSLAGSALLPLLAAAQLLLLLALIRSPGRLNRSLAFFVTLSLFLGGWEASKSLAAAVDYKITLPQPSWNINPHASLNDALSALESGAAAAVIADRKDLDDLMPAHPAENDAAADLPYQGLRYLARLDRSEGFAFLPISPAFPGRLSIALRAEEAHSLRAVSQLFDREIATVAGSFAQERFFSQPRRLVLLDLKILKDLNLPHLQMIAEAFLQPARRNGELLLLRILADAAVYTLSEAIFGFVFGATLGFGLGAIFAHSRLLERSLLPYVVASQTVPILAIAPMVVIWLGAGQLSVAVIATYLTFFPVTINTLRGLQSPAPQQLELMHSYAASRWTILWKLRLPSALPYIFTALKVSATASVVGAIIGELPSGIGAGLGRAILDFSSDYSMISTPKLWASIIMAAAVGVLFFMTVSLAERLVLRGLLPTAGGEL